MQLKTSSLREFIKSTGYIRPDKTFPATFYYYLDKNRIAKSNLSAFCEMEIECDISKPILIDQQKLQSFLNATKDETINISIGSEIKFSDTAFSATQVLYDPSNFPAIPLLPQLDFFKIDQPIIDALTIAKNFTSSNENMPHLNYVHINKNYIAATDLFILYHESFDKKFPNILLSRDEISLLQGYSEATLYNAETRYFFKTGKFVYSFAKTENKTPDFDRIIQMISIDGQKFVIDKSELQSFCELANSYTGSEIPSCTLSNETITFVDKTGEKIVRPVALGNDFEFTFNSRYILPALKSIPASELKCKLIVANQKALVIQDDNFICSLMGFQPKN